MSITELAPYLNFDGTAGKAIQLYERALGAKTEMVQRFADMPGNQPASEHKDRVMHARLRIGEGAIMISDTQPGTPLIVGNNAYVCLNFTDVAEMTRAFDALSAGGKVGMPLQDTFWGATFGFLTDAYGVNWMFNCTKR
jgi:PhnB protein